MEYYHFFSIMLSTFYRKIINVISSVLIVILGLFVNLIGVLPEEVNATWSLNRCINNASIITVPVSECQILEDMYNNLNGTNWTNTTNWFSTGNITEWYGIDTITTGTTMPNQRISIITLQNNKLIGSINGIIHDLPNLLYLDLDYNKLSGTIPSTRS